jgi:ParB/Sulfiredoxin domain
VTKIDHIIEFWPIDKVIPYEKNPRVHPEAQIELLARLIAKHGFDQAIVVDEKGIILKGHGRRLAAMKAGLDRVPVIVQHGMTDEDKSKVRIADNQLALLSRWDDALLRDEIAALKNAGFDLDELGFDQGQLNGFLLGTENGETDPEIEWAGMPEFKQDDKRIYKSVIVHFANQKAVDKFEKLLKIKIPAKNKFIWFPKMKIERYVDKEYRAIAGKEKANAADEKRKGH